jgi:hypothetical protein
MAVRGEAEQDVLIREIPEVENVLGKIGRVESALDPAPGVMIETYVMPKPASSWRAGATIDSIWNQINAVATLPGVTPASPLQPIEGRVVMLQSGIKAPHGDSRLRRQPGRPGRSGARRGGTAAADPAGERGDRQPGHRAGRTSPGRWRCRSSSGCSSNWSLCLSSPFCIADTWKRGCA